QVIVTASEGDGIELPEYYGHAYIPILVDGEVVSVVAAFVDETEQRTLFHNTFLVATVGICLLMTLSFGIPAIGWYLRTKEKQRNERRMRYLAHHDSLTGLINRPRLIERLQQLLASAVDNGTKMAVHFIDLDRFKEVNDTIGHDAGDFLLKTIGERLRQHVRADDLIARLGGDEFVAVQTRIENENEVNEFAERLIEELRQPIQFGEKEISVAVTIGAAIVPEHGTTPDRVLKSADLALYAGKSAGRGRVYYFSPDLDEAFLKRINLEKLIRENAANEEFVLYYQPIFEMDSGRLTGYEALLRLPSPDGSVLMPEEFLPTAEELRLTDSIGSWVIREACRMAATWPNDLIVSVNLSPSQFVSGELVSIVSEALQQSGLPANRLELEVTEMLLLGNTNETMKQLRDLKEMGVAVAMDDFGTGYSSLSYLWKFPFDKLKIDRSFMEDCEKSGHNVQTVIKTIIALSRELHLRVTVEGVENSDQVELLKSAIVDEVQGFYFGQPVQPADLGAHMLNALRDKLTPGNDQPAKHTVGI
nr:EAL domain-containing protein [Hyphomicrobiales bacterium]